MNYDLDKYPMDSEVLAYLEKVEASYPDASGALDPADNQRLYLAMCETFEYPIAEDVSITNHELPGRHGEIPIRIYENPRHHSPVTVIYYHGGGFVVGNLDSHNSLCADIAHETGFRVVAVDYRLAPAYRHPVHFEDALDTFLALDHGPYGSGRGLRRWHPGGCDLPSPSMAAAGNQQARCLSIPGSVESCSISIPIPAKPMPRVFQARILPTIATSAAPANRTSMTRHFIPWCTPISPTCHLVWHSQRNTTRFGMMRLNMYADFSDAGVKARCTVEEGLVHGYLRGRYLSRRNR